MYLLDFGEGAVLLVEFLQLGVIYPFIPHLKPVGTKLLENVCIVPGSCEVYKVHVIMVHLTGLLWLSSNIQYTT